MIELLPYRPGCDFCKARARKELPAEEARAWFEAHRQAKHPDAPDPTTQRRRRRAHSKSSPKGASYFTRRENVSVEELEEREVLRRLVRSDVA